MKIKSWAWEALLVLTAAAFAQAGIEIQLPGVGTGQGAQEATPQRSLPEAGDFGILELTNGERFKVAIERYDATQDLLIVRHPFMRGPVAVETSGLLRYLAEPSQGEAEDLPGWVLQLADGDRIRGEDFSLQGETLRGRTLYGDDLVMPRNAVMGIVASASRAIYEGPWSGEEWTVGGVRMYVETNSLAVPPEETMGRLIAGLPRRVRIDFCVTGAFTLSNLKVNLFAQRPGMPPGPQNPGYQFRITDNHIALLRAPPGQNVQEVGTQRIQVPSFNPRLVNEGLRLTVLADLDERRFHVMLDGNPIAQFTDKAPLQNPGAAISFSSGLPLIVKDIRVTRYDGRAAFAAPPPTSGNHDTLRLKSGETISGDLLSLRGEQALLRTPMGDLTIPVRQIESVQLKRAALPPAETLPSGAARLTFLDDSQLTAVIRKIEDGTVWLEHPRAGNLRFPLRAVFGIFWRLETAAASISPEARARGGNDAPPAAAVAPVRQMTDEENDVLVTP